jgi:hypothetical protein
MNTFTFTEQSALAHYCLYKGLLYIITGITGEGNYKIRTIFTPAGLCVKPESVELTSHRPATLVGHQYAEYIVTGKGVIFSCATGKIMKWDEHNGNRRDILAAVRASQA